MYSGDFSARFRGMYDQNDCALFFTISGETREVIDRIKELKNYLITHNQQVNPIDEIILTHKCQEN